MVALKARLDRETGASGTFQVIDLVDDEGNDLTYLVGQSRHFHSLGEVKEAILNAIAEDLTIEEV